MKPFIRLISINEKKSNGETYYSSLDLPKEIIGHFCLYALLGGISVHRTIPKSKHSISGLRFGREYIGKTVEVFIVPVDDSQSIRACSILQKQHRKRTAQ